MNHQPSFSVVICNYNYARYVGDAIRSALSQDYPPDKLQVIVVDDGSTDDSRAVYSAFADDPRFIVVLQENRGQTGAFEAGVRVATGHYVCLLDSDDRFEPHKLARVASHIAGLGEHPYTLFLRHDLAIENTDATGTHLLGQTWFDVVTTTRLPDCLTLQQAPPHYTFSIPCGLAFSRALITRCLQAIPSREFNNGADGVRCPAAFISTGRTHYLREGLGVYRLHGDDEFAKVVDGRYLPRYDPTVRESKALRFLEHGLDQQDMPLSQRMSTLHYLRRREHHTRRLSASLRLTEPSVAVNVLRAADATLGGCRASGAECENRPQRGQFLPDLRSHSPAMGPEDGGTWSAAVDLQPATPKPDSLLVQHSISNSLQSHDAVQILPTNAHGAIKLAQMATAWTRDTAEYVVFMRPGDTLDRTFVKRHLQVVQHGAIIAASCSDIRLISADGSLVHANVFSSSGAWKQPIQQVPPLATSLRDWAAPPMAGCMFRRKLLLDRLFAHAPSAPPALQDAGFWLLMQFAHHTGGLLRLRETLSSCRLHDGAAASCGYLFGASRADGSLIAPPITEAMTWLHDFHQQQQALLRQWLPESWHRRFGTWLSAHRTPGAHSG